MVTCRICKKPFLDVPNVALDKIFTLIALPCKYSSQGCTTFAFQTSRLQHETVCQFRPVSCQFQHLGCQQVSSIKDMASHHKICRYSDKENKISEKDTKYLLVDNVRSESSKENMNTKYAR